MKARERSILYRFRRRVSVPLLSGSGIQPCIPECHVQGSGRDCWTKVPRCLTCRDGETQVPKVTDRDRHTVADIEKVGT